METIKNNKNRHLMPNKNKILDYWADQLILDYNKFWLDAIYEYDLNAREKTDICFACGSNSGTERCHINSVDQGGSHDINNLHLLCKECHLESEWFNDTDLYFDWFMQKKSLNSGSYLKIINKANVYINAFIKGNTKAIPNNILMILNQHYERQDSTESGK